MHAENLVKNLGRACYKAWRITMLSILVSSESCRASTASSPESFAQIFKNITEHLCLHKQTNIYAGIKFLQQLFIKVWLNVTSSNLYKVILCYRRKNYVSLFNILSDINSFWKAIWTVINLAKEKNLFSENCRILMKL